MAVDVGVRVAGGVTVGYKGRTVILTAGQALASAGGRLVSLPAPPVKDGRRWLVPVEFVAELEQGGNVGIEQPDHVLAVLQRGFAQGDGVVVIAKSRGHGGIRAGSEFLRL